jgi:hypothetical protein
MEEVRGSIPLSSTTKPQVRRPGVLSFSDLTQVWHLNWHLPEIRFARSGAINSGPLRCPVHWYGIERFAPAEGWHPERGSRAAHHRPGARDVADQPEHAVRVDRPWRVAPGEARTVRPLLASEHRLDDLRKVRLTTPITCIAGIGRGRSRDRGQSRSHQKLTSPNGLRSPPSETYRACAVVLWPPVDSQNLVEPRRRATAIASVMSAEPMPRLRQLSCTSSSCT